MGYFLGVDGGATKTKTVLGNEKGEILGIGEGPPSNFQLIGLEGALEAIKMAVGGVLAESSLSLGQVERTVFGLAGADLPAHFRELEKALSSSFPSLSFRVVNDTWIALKGGARKGWGVALVCGTGGNACICTPQGEWFTVRGMGYEYGLGAGALYMIRDILHYAFRSYDGIGPKTKLEQEVLKSLSLPGYDVLADMLFSFFVSPSFTSSELRNLLNLVPVLFELASEGDEVCQSILLQQGRVLGEIGGWLIKRMRLEDEDVEVVLVGGVYGGENPLLMDQLTLSLHQLAPSAKVVFPLFEPAIGGYLLALEDKGVYIPASGISWNLPGETGNSQRWSGGGDANL
ncbi:hypothetical protein HKBW3S44_00396 [Candidatus Hakubella thermalkaliphila]|uniref:ATPase BadF/BadG/BcrA/BcrD type domain-containing protein n=1 Tax=Candidatus Hakubella thermalkaliphila TaxID=2754717 RepID=A0A6V8PW10_9ACTN|nr:BadF/BadG/BcrA/BcrD ATPase family protein [Candidatus Hakubella thermalkaliphila]GFP31181.1 hypothetical protein HKBW3S34_02100 [Candidatus Hakubella thermalkaliphila]GFP36715.1 hypothetical protein HKBW3S44_00396 [Candidatus Hakubella thermalkaliphila]GFP39337.1 hypothetical protein HKBW3S47_01036 [Candidatus Hakubella thermalkaliphila]